MTQYLNSREACSYLGIKDFKTIYRYIKLGQLLAYKLGRNGKKNNKRHWRFLQEDLDNFVVGK